MGSGQGDARLAYTTGTQQRHQPLWWLAEQELPELANLSVPPDQPRWRLG